MGMRRLAVAVLSAVALLTFFLPLVSVRTPDGTRAYSGYDAVVSARAMRQIFAAATDEVRSKSDHVPLSMRFAGFPPVLLALAYLGGLWAIAGTLGDLRRSAAAGLFGMASAVLSIIHLSAVESVLRYLPVSAIAIRPGPGLYVLAAALGLAAALAHTWKFARVPPPEPWGEI